ncbi:protein SAAL1-like [Corticium candelabrum]|uniref:protein SAAL1-like n=1 Tax=Corticium candelabrum TaxID=121492 RepID=UPI002E272F7C|nr:protein SAAL1-like [Corticium candelabrum]
MCSYRNPSPPREEEEPFLLGDAIGDTVYSKRWVLSVVADLCKYAHARCATTERLPADCDVIDETDMDEEWEQELCKLWDASVDEDVSCFLYEVNATDVALQVIAVTQLPRLREICVGVLGNMACCLSVRIQLCQRSDFLSVIREVLMCGDPPTLIEAVRLIRTCVCDENCRVPWLTTFRESEFQNSLLFILESSTNENLLTSVAQLVDDAVRTDSDLASVIAGPRCMQAICEAFGQVRQSEPSRCDVFLLLMQALSSTEQGIQSLVEVWASAWSLVCAHICACVSTDIHSAVNDQILSTAAACSLLSILIENNRSEALEALETLQDAPAVSIVTALEQLQRLSHESDLEEEVEDEALQTFRQILNDVVNKVQRC